MAVGLGKGWLVLRRKAQGVAAFVMAVVNAVGADADDGEDYLNDRAGEQCEKSKSSSLSIWRRC